MIEIMRTEVMNFDGALRGMRNPKDSWHLSDSYINYKPSKITGTNDSGEEVEGTIHVKGFVIGPKDLDLCKRLCNGGPVHRKFLRQIFVCMDVNAPLYWWKEFDTYKVSTTANSCSTMHKITAYPITIDMFAHDRVDDKGYKILEKLAEDLEYYRQKYLETKDTMYWNTLIQLLPSSWMQKRTITLDYETLVNIYMWRHNHKLEEWITFCKWITTLPYGIELIVESALNDLANQVDAGKWRSYMDELEKNKRELTEDIANDGEEPDGFVDEEK